MIQRTDIYHRRSMNDEIEYKSIQTYFYNIFGWQVIAKVESHWEVTQPENAQQGVQWTQSPLASLIANVMLALRR